MNNFKNILKQFGDTYFIEDVINKNKVIQDLDGYNTLLIEAFIKDETIKKNFTINVSGNTVIQINKLIELFEMDEYWKDSYTKYSKKIGLTTNTKFIDETTDIVLDFPYKDTILKASMSKEDTDKDELRPNEPQYLKNLVNSLDEMNLPTGEDKKNPLLDVKVKNSFKKTSVWKYGKIYYNETVKVSDAYYDNLEKYGVNTTKDEKIHYSSVIKEVNYKAAEVYEDFSDTYDIALTFDHRYLDKVMNRLSFYHFSNLKKYIPLLKSREEFLGEKWLNIFNRTIYITLPRQFDIKSLTSNEKLKILEQYFIRVSKQIKSGYNKERGTGKFIGYPIKEYITNYRKRIPKYDTGKFMINEPQIVQRYEFKESFFAYDSAIINKTEKQLIDRIAYRVKELEEVYSDIYLIRMDENMHRESKKNNNLKLHQFGTFYEAKNLAGFQPDFILFLQNKEYFIQIFIEPKGKDIENQQWKENLLLYINEHEAEIILEDTIENVKIKGVKFYTMDDKRSSIKQLGNIALGKDFKGLSIDN